MNYSIYRKLAILLTLSVSSMTAIHAQEVGLKAGANFSTLNGSDASGLKNRVGFLGGILINAPLTPRVSLQPEAMFSAQGANASDNSGSLSTAYINIPLLIKYTGASGLFAETGPQFGLLMSAKVNSGGTSVDVKDAYKSTDFSFVFGFGYFAKPAGIGFDLRYNLGISNIEDNGSNLSQGGSIKNSVTQFSIFFLFK